MSDDLRRTPFEAANALPVGTRLGEFEVRQVLGIGGFGIVYLAFDHALEREVAVKEYMPASMAGRTQTMHVSLRSQSDADVFALGLRSFVNEAKLLARFDHPSLLKVFRFWEANGTAYMAMPVLRGRTLKDIRQARPSLDNRIDERWLRGLLDPLLVALDKLHSEAVYHRDIAPDNIVIEPDGHPVLLDFGAARRVISDRTQTLTAILKPAYAPIEQYAEAGSVKQGPWTDLYALGATLHYMLLGQAPAPATARAVNDDHEPPLASRSIDGCSGDFLAAVDWMLAPRPGDRPQSVAALRAVLDGRAPLPWRPPPAATSAQWEPTAALPRAPAPAASSPSPNPPLSTAPAAAPQPSARQDPTVVVPPSRPPARADASSPSSAALPSQVAPVSQVAPASDHASRASGGGAAAGSASPSAAAAAPAGRGKALPIGIGVAVLAAVAAIALWPRAANGPSGQVPSVTVPPAVTSAAPPVAIAASDAAPVTTSATPRSPSEQGAPALPAAARPPASATLPAPPATAGPAATPADKLPAPRSGQMPATTGTAAPRPTGSDPRVPAAAPVPGTAAATPPTEALPATTAPAAPAAVGGSAPTTAKPNGPEAQCGGRNAVLYFACMERMCSRSRFQQHPECLEWHKNARQREPSGN
jgi:serine/threonine protein kinase